MTVLPWRKEERNGGGASPLTTGDDRWGQSNTLGCPSGPADNGEVTTLVDILSTLPGEWGKTKLRLTAPVMDGHLGRLWVNNRSHHNNRTGLEAHSCQTGGRSSSPQARSTMRKNDRQAVHVAGVADTHIHTSSLPLHSSPYYKSFRHILTTSW